MAQPPLPLPLPLALARALAVHRFGLGEADAATAGDDPVAWLIQQLGPADAAAGGPHPDTAAALALQAEARATPAALATEQQPAPRAASTPSTPGTAGAASTPSTPSTVSTASTAEDALRRRVVADQRSRLLSAATSQRPLAERLVMFWSNHFSVSLGKGAVRGLVGAFEREAIRPHIAGHFVHLLTAATTHTAMLRYLDNRLSAGPQSRQGAGGQRRINGLNENLARELLELHTLGASGAGEGRSDEVGAGAGLGGGDGAQAYGPWGGYSQADVVQLALVLTGWRGLAAGAEAAPFDPRWHQPGPKTVLGRAYPPGPQALGQVLADLARHPSTARFICTKLARHWVADQPPRALVDTLVRAWHDSDGHIGQVMTVLIQSPLAWQPEPAKLKTPEELVLSAARLLRLGERLLQGSADGGLGQLGQRLQAAPSPAGWPDRADDWLGPEALWRRVEWAHRMGQRLGPQHDARARAAASLGPLLGRDSRQQIERAADGAQALTLLLLAPEFQRR